MKKTLLLAALSVAVPTSLFALPDYEPFSGTGYSAGTGLVGLTDGGGQSWFQAGSTSGSQPTLRAGDITISGLASSGGGLNAGFGGTGGNARLNMSVSAGGITTGTVYYSMALQLTSLGTLNTTAVFITGLNNAQGSQTSTPNTVVDQLTLRTATGGFNVGLLEGSAVSTSGISWDSADVFTTSSKIFVVASYTFNPLTGDDVAQMWINPSSTSFGAGSAPTATLTSSGGTDIARVASFVLYDRSANEPTGGIDDVRIGTTWADVTPPTVVPEPTTIGLAVLGVAGLLARKRFSIRKK